MNPLESRTLDQLRERTSMKWRAYPDDVLPLWVAEMDVDPAPAVVTAVCEAMRDGDTGYPAGDDYAEAFGAFAREHWSWDGVRPERTGLVADVMAGVVEAVKLVTRPGDLVVVNSPVYPPFFAFVELAGRRIVEAPLTEEHRLDLDDLDRLFTDASAFLLCNPHNPTGTVHTRDELAAVAALAAKHGVRVVADEIHAPLVLPGAVHTPYLSLDSSGFAVFSASKGWNLAGLKAALVVAGEDAAADLARIPEVISHGPSHLGVIAHVAALRDGGGWLDDLLVGLDGNRRLLLDLVAERLPAVRLRAPEATFLSWLDFRDVPGLPAEDAGERGNVRSLGGPAAYLLEHARVALSAGSAFGAGGVGHARLNYAAPAAVLTEAVQRIAAALP